MSLEYLEAPEGAALTLVTHRILESLGLKIEHLSTLISDVLGIVDGQVQDAAATGSRHPSSQDFVGMLNAAALIECVGHFGLASATLIDEAITSLHGAATNQSQHDLSADDIHALKFCASILERLVIMRNELATAGSEIARHGQALLSAVKRGEMMLEGLTEFDALLRRLRLGGKKDNRA